MKSFRYLRLVYLVSTIVGCHSILFDRPNPKTLPTQFNDQSDLFNDTLIATNTFQNELPIPPQVNQYSNTNIASQQQFPLDNIPDNIQIDTTLDTTGHSAKKLNLPSINIINIFLRTALSTVINDPDLLKIAVKYFSFVFWAVAFISIIGTFGVDTKPLLSLFSVLGITVGLALKDILTNTFAGLLIILTSPFKRGWIISVEGCRGRVLSIDTRYVRLQSLRDKSEILVPLSLIYKSTITIERRD